MKFFYYTILFFFISLQVIFAEPVADQVRMLIDKKEYDTSILLLKKSLQKTPDSQELVLLMAKSYMAKGNHFWALKTLSGYLKTHPDQLEVLSWKAWIESKSGNTSMARKTLTAITEETDGEILNRKHLLLGISDIHENKLEGLSDHLKTIHQHPYFFPEDYRLYQFLTRNYSPEFKAPLNLTCDTIYGFTTDPYSDLPESYDDQEGNAHHVGINASLVFEPYQTLPVHPYLGAKAEENHFFTEHDNGFDTFDIETNLKLKIRLNSIWLKTGYHGGMFYSDVSNDYSGDTANFGGSNWLYEFHRFETDISLKTDFIVFVGGGERVFRYGLKSRKEADIGVYSDILKFHDLSVASIFLIRKNWAKSDLYDLFGGSLGLSLFYDINEKSSVNIHSTLFYDVYDEYQSDRRKDMTVDVISTWTIKLNKRFYIDLSYTYNQVISTFDDEDNQVHSIEMNLGTRWDITTRKINITRHENHVEIPYDIDRSSVKSNYDRVRKLLEQRESIRKGSSCIN